MVPNVPRTTNQARLFEFVVFSSFGFVVIVGVGLGVGVDVGSGELVTAPKTSGFVSLVGVELIDLVGVAVITFGVRVGL